MQMEAFLWLFLPVFVAGGSALLSYYVMQARMEVALAKERESLAEARAMISAHKVTLDERVKATEEACKRQALDDFMHDIRVDERSYVRESKSLNGSKKNAVRDPSDPSAKALTAPIRRNGPPKACRMPIFT